MNATSEARPENELSQNGHDSKPRRRPSRRGLFNPWLLPILGTMTLATGVALWIAFAWPAALVVTFVTAVCGLAKALIELHLLFEKREVEANQKTALRRRKKLGLAPVVSAALLLGIGVGYVILPGLVDTILQPSGAMKVPATVDAAPTADVYWQNVPSGEEVRVFVRATGSSIDFVQRCRGQGRRGVMSCELEVGGVDAEGKFEIIVARLAQRVSEQLTSSPVEGAYLTGLPEGAQILVSKSVSRK